MLGQESLHGLAIFQSMVMAVNTYKMVSKGLAKMKAKLLPSNTATGLELGSALE